MAHFANISIETTQGVRSLYIYDERFDDGDTIRRDGSAETADLGTFAMLPEINLADWEAECDMTFAHSPDGWVLKTTKRWSDR